MPGNPTFLTRQKKADLVELAEGLGLDTGSQKKFDLEIAIEIELNNHPEKYADDSRYSAFYGKKRGDSSPVKREISTSLEVLDSKTKALTRRATKAVEEYMNTDESESEPVNATRSRSALVQTPRRVPSQLSRIAQDIPLPPSPAVVADAIDQRTAVIRARIADAYDELGIVEVAEQARETLSSVVAVQALIIAFELYKLRPEILADYWAFTIPAISFLNTNPRPVAIPDLFLLLSSSFWSPAITWAVTTFFVPLFASYFVNLTSKPKGRNIQFSRSFDPLVFNIVKALLVYVVFGQDATFGGLIDLEDVARINSAVYGGYQGVLVGTGIGALVTIYEAAIKK